LEFERLVSAQCDSLIQMIHERREFLLDTIRLDKEAKLRTLKVLRKWRRDCFGLIKIIVLSLSLSLSQEQQIHCTGKLTQTTGLIQFCIEALKETDSAAFLQVSRTTTTAANEQKKSFIVTKKSLLLSAIERITLSIDLQILLSNVLHPLTKVFLFRLISSIKP